MIRFYWEWSRSLSGRLVSFYPIVLLVMCTDNDQVHSTVNTALPQLAPRAISTPRVTNRPSKNIFQIRAEKSSQIWVIWNSCPLKSSVCLESAQPKKAIYISRTVVDILLFRNRKAIFIPQKQVYVLSIEFEPHRQYLATEQTWTKTRTGLHLLLRKGPKRTFLWA